jgi:PadR family transcriptional regulator, regulatory protein PadR
MLLQAAVLLGLVWAARLSARHRSAHGRRMASAATMLCMVAGDAENQVAQLRRGVLPYCVLAMLRRTERYGFELVRALGSVDGMVTGEGTIYPLLARLRRQGLVATTWQESASGPPRRYYRITPAGNAALADFAQAWAQLRVSVDELLEPK